MAHFPQQQNSVVTYKVCNSPKSIKLCRNRLLLWLSHSAATNSLQSYGLQPIRGPWDSPGKKTGVGCHFLLQREEQCCKFLAVCSVFKQCPTLHDPINCSMSDFPAPHHLPKLPKFMSSTSMMPSNYLILCYFCLQSFPASGFFPVSQLFASGAQNIDASASVLPMSIQD